MTKQEMFRGWPRESFVTIAGETFKLFASFSTSVAKHYEQYSACVSAIPQNFSTRAVAIQMYWQ